VKKLDALTSLRFFAAAMIVLGHSDHLFGSLGIASTFSLSQGVSFFFTLSGFILAYNYSSLPDWAAANRFLISRFARIWPLHIATLLLWIVLITPEISREFSTPISAAIKLFANITLLQSWTFTAPYVLSFNGVAWSISTEAFFYAAFAVIALSPKRLFPITMLLGAVSAAAFIYAATVIPLSSDDGAPGVSMFGVLYTNPLTRILEFLFGICCAHVYKAKAGSIQKVPPFTWLIIELAALASIIYALYVVANPAAISRFAGAGVGYYMYKEGIWLLWGALILVFACSRGPIARALSVKPLVFLGEISFALYLVHMIIFNLASYNATAVRETGVWGTLGFWLVCIGASAALHITIENPFRRMIVDWWDGTPWKNTSKLFRAPQWACFTLLVCGSALAASYKPSTVVEISPSTISANPDAVVAPANRFANGISLTHISVSTPKNGIVDVGLYFTAEDDVRLNRHIGVHLNGSDGQILQVVGDIVIDRSDAIHKKGFSWFSMLTVKETDLRACASVGLAIFQDVNNLDVVASGPSDWGGKRLVIDVAALKQK
jgi:peptidoglycan/LPS O-acetylase OafA/YrhL